MPIDMQSELLLSLTDAAKTLPKIDGKRPHTSTLWRWCRKGLRGVRLEYIRLGNRICTSADALSRFANELAATDSPPSLPKPQTTLPFKPRSISDRDAEILQASERLARDGI